MKGYGKDRSRGAELFSGRITMGFLSHQLTQTVGDLWTVRLVSPCLCLYWIPPFSPLHQGCQELWVSTLQGRAHCSLEFNSFRLIDILSSLMSLKAIILQLIWLLLRVTWKRHSLVTFCFRKQTPCFIAVLSASLHWGQQQVSYLDSQRLLDSNQWLFCSSDIRRPIHLDADIDALK